MNEIKYKALLGKAEYEKLSCYLRSQYPCEAIQQINDYYDALKFELFFKNETLQIRVIEDKKTMNTNIINVLQKGAYR